MFSVFQDKAIQKQNWRKDFKRLQGQHSAAKMQAAREYNSAPTQGKNIPESWWVDRSKQCEKHYISHCPKINPQLLFLIPNTLPN